MHYCQHSIDAIKTILLHSQWRMSRNFVIFFTRGHHYVSFIKTTTPLTLSQINEITCCVFWNYDEHNELTKTQFIMEEPGLFFWNFLFHRESLSVCRSSDKMCLLKDIRRTANRWVWLSSANIHKTNIGWWIFCKMFLTFNRKFYGYWIKFLYGLIRPILEDVFSCTYI